MYILSIDLGSSNSKAIVMQIEENAKEGSLKFIGKVRTAETNFAVFISEVLKKFNINPSLIETIVATGTGSSFLDDEYKYYDVKENRNVVIKIVKVDEFDAIGYGGLILSKNTEGIVVSIGTGTAIIYSDLDKNVRIGGTGLGGGTLVGLGNALLKLSGSTIDEIKDNRFILFKDLIDIAKKGDYRNVNLTISDINKGNIGNLTADITAANFAGINKKANSYDCIAGIINLIVENICLLIHCLIDSNKVGELKKCKDTLPIIFIGTMVTDDYICDCIKTVGKYTKDKYCFIKDADIAIAIGAYEYYLIRLRKNY